MTHTAAPTPTSDGPEDPAAHPHLQPADATDDLSAHTERGAPEPAGLPREGGPSSGAGSAPSDLLDDAAGLGDAGGTTRDDTPGDGTAGSPPAVGDVDVVQTAAHGREDDAAEVDTSDTTPTPTETHEA